MRSSTAAVRRSQRFRRALERLGLLPAPPEGLAFHAFISYSHAADGPLARALQRGLQRFAKPWNRARALHVFRDEASLAANPNLWKEIERALDASQYYILLASPTAAASDWVRKEAERWMQTKPHDHLLVALTDGQIVWDRTEGDFDWEQTTALPPTLRGAFEDEPPFWVDLRWAREATDLSLSDSGFADAVVSLAAPIHCREKDELAGEEIRQHRRTMRIARTVVAALLTLTVIAIVAGIIALIQRSDAIANQRAAQSRALAVEADTTLDTDPGQGALLALEAYRSAPTLEARSALLSALEHPQDRILRGTANSVTGVALSPDGRTIASVSTDGWVRLWDYASGRQRTAIRSQGPLRSVAFSPDGKQLAWGGEKAPGATGFVSIRPLIGGGTLTTDVGINVASALVFSADDKTVFAGSYDGSVSAVDAIKGRLTKRVQALDDPVLGIASRGPTLAVVGGGTRPIVVFRADRRQPLILGAPNQLVYSVALDHTGNLLATGDGHGNLTLWDTRRGTRLGPVLGAPDAIVHSLSFSPDDAFIAAGYSDRAIRIWSVAAHRQVATLTGHAGGVSGVAFGPHDELVSSSTDETIRLWDPHRLDEAAFSVLGKPFPSSTFPHGFVAAPAVSSDHRVSVGSDSVGDVLLRDAQSRRTIAVISNTGEVNSVAFSRGDRLVAVAGQDELIHLIDLAHQGRVRTLIGSDGVVDAVAFSPDGTTLVSASEDGTVRIWDTASGQELGQPIPINADAAAIPARLASIDLNPASAPVILNMTLAFDRTGRFMVGANAGGEPLMLPPVLLSHSSRLFERYLCPVVRGSLSPAVVVASGVCSGSAKAPPVWWPVSEFDAVAHARSLKARFVQRGDAVCSQFNGALTPSLPKAWNDEGAFDSLHSRANRMRVASDFRQFAALFRQEVADLQRLSPPPGDRSTVDGYIAAIAKQTTLLAEIGDLYGSQVPVQTLLARARSLGIQEQNLVFYQTALEAGQAIARAYGFHVCGWTPFSVVGKLALQAGFSEM